MVLGNRFQEVAPFSPTGLSPSMADRSSANSANDAIFDFPASPETRPIRPHDPRTATTRVYHAVRV